MLETGAGKKTETADIDRYHNLNPGPVLRLDTAGIILFANAAAHRLFSSAQGLSWLRLCPQVSPVIWQQILASHAPYQVESAQGDLFMRFTHVSSAEGYVLVFGADITANRINEKKLEEQANAFAEIARFPHMNPGPVLRMDTNGLILLSNEAAEAVFGKDLLGKNWLEVMPDVLASWESITAVEDAIPIELKIEDKYYVFHHRHDKKTELVFVYGIDITPQKEAERNQAEIARFPDMNPGPVLRMDLDGLILLSNAAATSVFGENLLHKNWQEICPGINDRTWKKIVASAEIFPIEARLRNRDYVFNHRRDFKTDLVFVFGADITLQKSTEQQLRQSEKMATLGTLAAGVAHELNNPAAATTRAAQQLRNIFSNLEQAHVDLNAIALTDSERDEMLSLAAKAQNQAGKQSSLDALARSDKEVEIEDWLSDHNIENGWELASPLVDINIDIADLEDLTDKIRPQTLSPIIRWVAHLFPVYSLLHELAEGSTRISEIVVALKNYSYLGQAPVQAVNVHEGIDNTLVILRNKLKVGITVNREYAESLPMIMAYGSELNQVWTNLLDNAADAMKGKGEITIRTRKENDWVIVEIEDNGPGIPAEIQSRIFDPFFTTKEPGKGTGLGLSTSYGIVTEKHKGKITVKSHPGFTQFTVRLPITEN